MDPVRASAVTIGIGELEIEGIDPGGRFDVARGLELELAQLLRDRGVPQRLLSGDAGQPPSVSAAGLSPIDLGRAVARAMYEGWQ
jgi:hypothetical protein